MYFLMDIKRNREMFVFMYFLMLFILCWGLKFEIFVVNVDFDDFVFNGEILDIFLLFGDLECVLRCLVRDECFFL